LLRVIVQRCSHILTYSRNWYLESETPKWKLGNEGICSGWSEITFTSCWIFWKSFGPSYTVKID